MADEGPTSEIKDELKAILGTADWATLTERKVRDLLCDKFGNVAQTQSVRSLIAVRHCRCTLGRYVDFADLSSCRSVQDISCRSH